MGTSGSNDRVLLREAVVAFRAGNNALARSLLRSAAEHNPESELVWLWRASLAQTPAEAVSHLREVLRINADNEKATFWLNRLTPNQP